MEMPRTTYKIGPYRHVACAAFLTRNVGFGRATIRSHIPVGARPLSRAAKRRAAKAKQAKRRR